MTEEFTAKNEMVGEMPTNICSKSIDWVEEIITEELVVNIIKMSVRG